MKIDTGSVFWARVKGGHRPCVTESKNHHKEGPSSRNHHFTETPGSVDGHRYHLVYPWFNCSTTTISFCVSVVFDHATEPGSLNHSCGQSAGSAQHSSTCSGFPGVIDCTADKMQIQYWVLGTVYWRYITGTTLRNT